MELILVRHGQSESNARLTTELDAPLTPLGVNQAVATADYLAANVLADSSETAVLVSPFRRTLQTCEPLAKKLTTDISIYPKMCEYFWSEIVGYSSFQGLTHTEIASEFPSICEFGDGVPHPWWPHKLEDIRDIHERMKQVKDDLWHLYGGSDTKVVVYSHAEPIGRLIEVFLQEEPSAGWPPWTENCGINRLIVDSIDSPAEIKSLNYTSHLSELGLISPIYQ